MNIENKIETLRQNWINKIRQIESQGTPTLLPRTRRFWKDKFHAYGWQVGFKVSVQFADGQIIRVSFSDIGTRRESAISNAMRSFGTNLACQHPSCETLYAEFKTLEAKFESAKQKLSTQMASQNWRENERKDASGPLRAKIGQWRERTGKFSRKECWNFTQKILAGEMTFAAVREQFFGK